MIRMLLLAALGLLIATLSPHQTWARASVEAGPYGVRALLVGQATEITPREEVPANSWLPKSMKVSFEEMLVATGAVTASFAAAAGTVAFLAPPRAQLALFAGLMVLAATPIDGLIIGGGAIAAYRYYNKAPLDTDLEDSPSAWIDNWSYRSN
jgi:hypothetical protein